MNLSWFKDRSYVSQVILIVIILYAVSSSIVLGMAWGIFPHLPGAYLNSEICVVYSIISFVLTAFIAAYHLSTMFRRRKRKTDRLNVKPGTPAA